MVVVSNRLTPWPDRSFQAVAYDPAYKLNGTPTAQKDERYGVHVVATRAGRPTTSPGTHDRSDSTRSTPCCSSPTGPSP